MELEENQVFFNSLIASGFKHCTQIPTTGNAAKILTTNTRDGRRVVLKIFKDRPEDGVKARDLFELELLAHQSLRSTGRIPEVVFSWRGHNGQYFIVKPYYEKFLDAQRNMLTPLEVLELAAQEVDISEKFFALGWRDLDGRYSNDAIDERGRLIRVDLDGAYVSWAVSPKFVTEHHTRSDGLHCSALFRANREVFSKDSEIRSLAIRVSRLLLRNEEVPWELLERVAALRRIKRQSFKDSIRHYLTAGLRRFQFKTDGNLRKNWLEAWQNALARGDVLDGALTPLEAKLLALLFFHILTQNDHQFSLRDLYHSLMIVTVDCLQTRARAVAQNQSGNSEQIRRQFGKLVQNLYEVKQLHYDIKDRQEIEPRQMAESPPPSTVVRAESFTVEPKYDGNSWAATTKGPAWESQDIVLVSRDVPCPTFLLADGASGAGGNRAIEIVQEVYDAWLQDVKARTLDEAKSELCDLIRRTNDQLAHARKQSGGKIETAVAAVSIFQRSSCPSVLFIRYGDTGYLVTHEDLNGSLRPVLGTKADENHPPPLGSRENWNIQPFEELKVLNLEWEGLYRVRAFSDGVGSEEHAWGLMGAKANIHDLVQEAEEWTKHPQIGGDDWSIAGFDLKVKRSSLPIQETFQAPVIESDFSLESLNDIEVSSFPMSEGSLRFWKRTIAPLFDRSKQSQHPLIRSLLRHPSLPDTGTTAVLQDGSTDDRSNLFRYAVFALLSLAAAASMWFGARWLMSGRQGGAPNLVTSRSDSQSRELQFENQQQRDIYLRLNTRQGYVLTGIPAGYKTDQVPFKDFIADLAHVLKQTEWTVAIDVHTDIRGGPQENQKTSSRRASEIRTRLAGEGIPEKKVEVHSLGESRPLIYKEDNRSNAENRRLEIYRVDN